MSVRSHLFAAAAPAGLLLGAFYVAQSVAVAKSAETTQLDVYLSKQQLRSCGVEKLRSSSEPLRLQDDAGGLLVQYEGAPRLTIQIFTVSDLRTRIQGSWLVKDESPALRGAYEAQSKLIADLLVQCQSN